MVDKTKKEVLQNNLYELWEKELVPVLRAKEPERIKAYKSYQFWFCLAVISPIIWVIDLFVMMKIGTVGDTGFLIFMVVMFGSWFMMAFGITKANNISKSFDKYIKKDIIQKVLAVFSTVPEFNIEVDNSKRIDYSVINRNNIFVSSDLVDYDDSFSGEALGIPISIDELSLYYSAAKDKTKDNAYSVFGGCLISIDMNKNFKGHTIIKSKQLFSKFPDLSTSSFILKLFYFSEVIKSMKKLKDYSDVKTEFSKFNEKYDVLATDQVEARYLLTTVFIERFYNLKTAFKAKHISCSLKDNKILFAFSLKEDLFKLGYLTEPLTEKSHFTVMVDQILSLMDFVEYFKLNTKIGL